MKLRCLLGHLWSQWMRWPNLSNQDFSEVRQCVRCHRMECR